MASLGIMLFVGVRVMTCISSKNARGQQKRSLFVNEMYPGIFTHTAVLLLRSE